MVTPKLALPRRPFRVPQVVARSLTQVTIGGSLEVGGFYSVEEGEEAQRARENRARMGPAIGQPG